MRLDVLYHSAIRFTTNVPYRTHHCTIFSVNWYSLYTCRKTHWLMLIYKNLTPSLLRYLLQPSSSTYNTCSASHILLKVPKAHTSPLFSSLQLATGMSCKKTLKSLHSKTQSWTLLLTVVAASRSVLLSLPSCTLSCWKCPMMFVPCFVLLPCCAAAMVLACCVATMLCCCLRALFM